VQWPDWTLHVVPQIRAVGARKVVGRPGRFNDFWRYLVRPADRLPREAEAVACSSSHLPGFGEITLIPRS